MNAKFKKIFERMYSETDYVWPLLDDVPFKQLSLEGKSLLQAPFALDGIK